MMLSIIELQKNPLFRGLKLKDQQFLENYIALDQDIEKAVELVYGVQGTKVAVKIRKLQLDPQIGRLLAIIDGEYKPTAEEIIHEVWKDLVQSDNPTVRHNNAELLAKMLGYIGRNAEASKPSTVPDKEFLENLNATTK